jgi:hypothetical protein
MATFVSTPTTVTLRPPAGPFDRADLEIHGLDHSKASFEGRIFLNSPQADAATPADEEHGYAGSFFVFGHGGCAGDEGHCDVPDEPARPFDLRSEHQLTRATKRVTIGDQLRRTLAAGAGEVSITVVPFIDPEDADDYPESLMTDLLDFERVALLTYEG